MSSCQSHAPHLGGQFGKAGRVSSFMPEDERIPPASLAGKSSTHPIPRSQRAHP